MSRTIFLLGLLLLGFVTNAQLPERPNPPRLVNDFRQVLSTGERNQLEDKLVAYDDSTSTQITIVIVGTTGGEDINFYAAQIGEKWQVGQKGKDNGAVICVAYDDRKVAIQTGYGLEEFLTAGEIKLIIENVVLPEFKAGDYYGGLDAGTDALIQALNGEFKGTGKKVPRGVSIGGVILLLVLLFVIASIIKRGGGGGFLIGPGGGHWHRGGFGGGSFGGFGGGGGGFGGFGGGSFGGSGASGSW